MRSRLAVLAAALLVFSGIAAHAATIGRSLPPGQLCRAAIQVAERGGGVPARLMSAIGLVESGRRDPETGEQNPWPWTINVEGKGYVYETKAAAVSAVRTFQSQGARSIDVGCMQINLMHHPDAFPDLDAAFDPLINARYAAVFLNELHGQSGDWDRATGAYHSSTPDLGADYLRRVLAIWPGEKRRAPAPAVTASAEPATMPSGRVVVTLPLNRMENIRIAPISTLGTSPFGNVGGGAAGRGLDAYRATPITLASRFRIGG